MTTRNGNAAGTGGSGPGPAPAPQDPDGTGAAAVAAAASVTELVRGHALGGPRRPAVALVVDPRDEDGARWWSYGELDEQARLVAGHLAGRYPPDSRVLLLYPVGLEFVGAFLACLYAGMVAVPAPLPGQYRHHRNRVGAIAADAGVSVVLTTRAHEVEVAGWLAQDTSLTVPVVATDAGLLPGEALEPVTADTQTLALLQYTSGSTGTPRGVMLDHGNLLHNMAAFVRASRWSPSRRSGGWIPLFHDMGLTCQLLPALVRGTSCVLMEPSAFVRRPHRWLQLVDRFDVAVSLAPNFAYDLCTRRVPEEALAGLDLSRWEFAANGSEPVKPGVMAAFAKRFAPYGFAEETFAPGYGLAEATVFVSALAGRAPVVRQVAGEPLQQGRMVDAAPGESAVAMVSCGPATHHDFRVVDPLDGTVRPEGRVGEVWLRSRSVSRGYWQAPEATARTFDAITSDGERGFLRTGDLGALVDGEIYVHGRIKDVVVVRGRNVHPHDVEHELRAQHPELGSTGAVFAVPGPDDEGEQLVVTHEVGALDQEELAPLAAAMARTVAREFGVPASHVVLLSVGAVRRTTSGKIQRSAMRDLYLAGRLEARHPRAAG